MRIRKKMPPKWDNIHIIQDILGKKLNKHEKWYVDCVKMVCGELLENAVKYYMKKGIKKKVDFYFSNTNGLIIGIRNQIIDKEDSSSLIAEIQRINGSVSPYNLYIERLQEIMDNRIKGESKLGLLRIASDGGFKFVYSLEKDKISVFAQKNKQGEDERMKALEYEDLRIEVKEVDNIVSVSWLGKCRTLNPEHILDSYLAQLTQFVKGKKVVVSFEKLDSMNSSTVPPLLTFIKALEENAVESEFLYNDKEDWQRASFRPLSVIAGKYEYVKIKAYNFQ